jgi:8-oxo-dGTP pyrophosphatase MutT (NUDIX family)
MAPQSRRDRPADFDPAHVRHAAGLVLLFPQKDRAHLVLTVRTDHVDRHRGQISLPGGAVDPGESFEQAALREAHEEIGLELAAVRTLGALTPIDIPVSGFRLHPIVAVSDGRPQFQASDLEVARILEVPLEQLMALESIGRTTTLRDGDAIDAPAFLIDGLSVWGATALVLAELLTLLGWSGPQD